MVEWAQTGALLAFAEVWPAWTFLLPDVALIGDDILRGSPLLLFGKISTRLNDYVFPDLGAVMRNAALTTAHLRALLEAERLHFLSLSIFAISIHANF